MSSTIKTLSVSEYHELCSADAGICCACGDIDDSSFYEPDAHNYRCPVCDELAVCGLEWALVSDLIAITDG